MHIGIGRQKFRGLFVKITAAAALQKKLWLSNSATKMPCLVAVGQLTANDNKEENFQTCKNLVQRAADIGAKVVFLPEACDYISASKEQSKTLAETIDGPLINNYQKLAATKNVWLSLGGLHIKTDADERLSVTHVLISNKGEIAAKYVKAHLFSVHIPERNLRLEERSFTNPGTRIVPPVETPAGNVALSICYDMRFPELSLLQRRQGAHVLTFPSAFTVATGLAHWHTLIKARAIETQCYVVAAAQTGQHNPKRSSFGHSIIVDPWGTVVAEVSEGTGIAVAEVDLQYLEKVRKEMPVMEHRRHDLYSLCDVSSSSDDQDSKHGNQPENRDKLLKQLPSSDEDIKFGQHVAPGNCTFLKTSLTLALVNRKPVVLGHCLLIPERVVRRFGDVTTAEIAELALATQRVTSMLGRIFCRRACSIAIQDGPAAGQTVEHVHIHAMPRIEKAISELARHDDPKNIAASNGWRTYEEMEKEAAQFRRDIQEHPHSEVIYENLEVKEENIGKEGILLEVASSHHCVAFLVGNPVLPWHVVVQMKRKSAWRINQLSSSAVIDLFQLAQRVLLATERFAGASSSTVFLTEEEQRQITLHVVPRHQDDFEPNDNLYPTLERLTPMLNSDAISEKIVNQAASLKGALL